MIYLKTCTKCLGDLLKTSDVYGHFLKCLQCGSIVDLDNKNTAQTEKTFSQIN